MVSNLYFAEQAEKGGYIGIPYKELDCQAFVEKVLADCGIKRNWKGSNDMWRNALKWRGTVDECIAAYGEVPLGAWLFTVRHDGGEVARGYHDQDGNAAHVGIRIKDQAIHSTTGGVQYCAFPADRWTHVGLAKDIDYTVMDARSSAATIRTLLADMVQNINEILKVIGDV